MILKNGEFCTSQLAIPYSETSFSRHSITASIRTSLAGRKLRLSRFDLGYMNLPHFALNEMSCQQNFGCLHVSAGTVVLPLVGSQSMSLGEYALRVYRSIRRSS